jgi:hypothetical protein
LQLLHCSVEFVRAYIQAPLPPLTNVSSDGGADGDDEEDEDADAVDASITVDGVPLWASTVHLHVFQLSDDGAAAEMTGGDDGGGGGGDDATVACELWTLPAREFNGTSKHVTLSLYSFPAT